MHNKCPFLRYFVKTLEKQLTYCLNLCSFICYVLLNQHALCKNSKQLKTRKGRKREG